MTPQLFIIEGSDCSGKTTLAKSICAIASCAYLHARGDKSLHLAMTAYHQSLTECAEVTLHSNCSVVLDRHWPSEVVYGTVFRKHVLDRYDLRKVVSDIEILSPTYIWCHSDKAAERQQKDPNHPYGKSEFAQVVGEYKSLYTSMMDDKKYRGRCFEYHLETHGTNIIGFLLKNKLVLI